MIATDLLIASRNLAKHTRRNLFLGGAIALITALLILLSSFTSGMRGAMLRSAKTLMTGDVNVGGFFKVTSGAAAPLVSDAPRVLELVRAQVPELDYLTVRGRGYAKVVSDSGAMDLVLAGVDIEHEPGFRKVVQVTSGSLDDLARPGGVLLFASQAKRLGVAAGDALTLSAPNPRGVQNTADVRVAAVVKDIGMISGFTGFVQAATLRELYQLRSDTTGAIHLYLKDPERAPFVAERVRGALAGAGYRVMEADRQAYFMKLMQKVNNEDWVGQKLDVSTWDDELSMMSWLFTALDWMTGLLVGILIAIVVVGIMNTLWIAIRERTREIGTLRAIGMQRRKVMWLFLLEAALLGLLGSVGGAFLGAGIAASLNALKIGLSEGLQLFLMTPHLHIAVRPATLAVAIGILSFVTALAAVYPAWRAARLAPVTAMHHIG